MKRRLEDLVLRGRLAILLVAALLTGLGLWSWGGLDIDNSPDTWFAGSGPKYDAYSAYRDRFGTDEPVFVVLRHEPHVFDRDFLVRIDRLTEDLERLPHVTGVTSLTSIEDIRATEEAIEISPLVAEPESLDDAELAALRERVLSDRFYPGMIVSEDGATTALIATIGSLSGEATAAAYASIRGVVESVRAEGIEAHVAGWLVVNETMNLLAADDIQRGFPTTLALLSLCLAFFFRSFRAVVVVLVAVVLAISWTMGAYAASGLPGTLMAGSTLPGILFALVFATGVHVVVRYQEENAREADPWRAMRSALRKIAPAVFLTSATTAIGLGSLGIATLPPVRHLGMFAAVGMAVTCIVCLTVVPIMLVTFPWRRPPSSQPWLERALETIAEWNTRRPWTILVATLALALVGALGIAHLRPQGTNLNYLPKSSEAMVAMRFIEDHFGPAGGTEIMVTGPRDFLKEPQMARAIESIQKRLEAYPWISESFAYTDLLKRMNQAIENGDPAAYRIPDTMEGIAQELFLYETSGGEELPDLVDVAGYDAARITSRMSAFISIEEWALLYRDIERSLPALAPEGVRVELTGDSPLWLDMNLTLLDTMGKSFLLALAGVSIMMILLVRSVRFGLLAMIPNVVPVLVVVGAMGWVGIELDFATVMVAGIALGIAVDDTIHYLARFRQELDVDGDADRAMRRTLTTVGKAMVTTSAVLCVGIGSMMLSNFPPHRTFAFAMSLTMILALLADLFLLPVLFNLAGARKLAREAPAGAEAPHAA